MILAHTGYTRDELLEIEYIYYNDLLSEITLKLQYMAIVNVLGRDYTDEKIFEFIESVNPINIDQTESQIEKEEREKVSNKVTIGKLREAGLI